MGIDMRTRGQAMESSRRAVRDLLSGQAVSKAADGSHQPLGLLPPESVQLWMGATADRALDRAARLGDGWIAPSGITRAEAVSFAACYLRARQQHGTGAATLAIRRDIYIAASPDAAWRARNELPMPRYPGYDPAARICGTADEAACELRALASDGFTNVLLCPFGRSHDDVIATIEQLNAVRRALDQV
jgi:alkanesulfonate monooxygenase SsuD/methylene tetrahydromethanopterin reductase-like flavin-dependent oxidoreductase (luciferase family)